MIKQQEILKLLKKEVKNRTGKNINISLKHDLEDDLGFDSLDKIELWLDLEEYFSIDIPEKEAKKFIKVGDIVEYLKKDRR